MAARRERERRRPSAERTYRFAAPEAAVEPADDLVGAAEPEEASSRAIEPASRRSRSERAAALDVPAARAGGRAVVHQSAAAFKAEYAYVIGDLRRVGLVIGSLLVALIVLYFVLPH